MDVATGAGSIETDDVLKDAKLCAFHALVGGLCASIMLIDGYSQALMGYIAAPIAQELNISPGALGPILSASLAGGIIGLLASSVLIHKLGQRKMAILSLAFFGAAEIIGAWLDSATGLLVFRFISGIGLSSALLCSVALTGEYFPVRWRATSVTYLLLGYTAGQMISGGATQLMTDMGQSWQAPMMLGGATALLLSLLLIRILPDSPEYLVNRGNGADQARRFLNRVSPVAIPDTVRLTARSKSAVKASVFQLFEGGQGLVTALTWVSIALTMMLSAFMHNWLTTMLVYGGMTYGDAVGVTVFVQTAGVIAGFTIGPLMDRIGPFSVLIGLMIIGAVATTVLAVMSEAAAFYGVTFAAFALGFCASGLSKGWHAAGVVIYPTSLRATGLGWLLGMGRAGAVVGPIGAGLLVEAGLSPPRVFQAIVIPLLLAATATYAAYRLLARQAGAGMDASREPEPEPAPHGT